MNLTRQKIRQLILESIKQDLNTKYSQGDLGKYVWPKRRKEKHNIVEPDTYLEKVLFNAFNDQLRHNDASTLGKFKTTFEYFFENDMYPELFKTCSYDMKLYRGFAVPSAWVDTNINKSPDSRQVDNPWYENVYNKLSRRYQGMSTPREVKLIHYLKPIGDENSVSSWSKDEKAAARFARLASTKGPDYVPIVLVTDCGGGFFLDAEGLYKYQEFAWLKSESEFIAFGPVFVNHVKIFKNPTIFKQGNKK